MGAALTPAQQRVLAYLRADTSGDFVVVPAGVCRDIRPFNALVDRGLIEEEWRRASLPPGSFHMVYRATAERRAR